MDRSRSFGLYREPWLTAHVPRRANYSRQLAEFHEEATRGVLALLEENTVAAVKGT